MSRPAKWANQYGPPAGGLERVRWFFLCFAAFAALLTPVQAVFSSPVPAALRAVGLPAFGYLLWRRLHDYRDGRLQPPGWDAVEVAALFVALLISGPLGNGLPLLYAGVFFRAVFGSTRRVVLGGAAYLLTLAASAAVAAQLSPAYGLHWQQQVATNAAGLGFTTLLMRLMLTTLLNHQRALGDERRLLSIVLDNVDSAVIAVDPDGTPSLRNRAALDLYAELDLPAPPAPWDSAVRLYRGDGRTPLLPEDLPTGRVLQGERVRDVEMAIALPDGGRRTYLVHGQPLADVDRRAGAVLTITDITARKRSEEQLAHLALHDPLTGLANRVLLGDRLEHALQRRSAQLTPPCLLLVDLDGFKTVNDSLGHQVGDEVLVVVAARLCMSVRGEDTVARLGGDEFAVLLEDQPQEVAVATAQRILEVLREPIEVPGRQVALTGSIGLASAAGAADGGELLRSADLAMYAAKNRGRNRLEVYEPSMHDLALQRLMLEADLRLAIARGELHLEYQPVVSLVTGLMTGVEALLRWRHPRLGAIAPTEFIPLAESSGLIVPIGEWVLGEATRQLHHWRRHHAVARDLTLAVNVAVPQLQSRRITEVVAGVLADTGLRPTDLVLEITESAMSEHHEVLPVLGALRDLGVALALDDFGTGYSSLSRLRLFPVQKVKIDRSFVHEIGQTADDPVLPTATLALAHGLGLEAVAEGVETAEQLHFLRRHGCEEVQGNLLSRPQDGPAIEAMLMSAGGHGVELGRDVVRAR